MMRMLIKLLRLLLFASSEVLVLVVVLTMLQLELVLLASLKVLLLVVILTIL